MSRWDKIESETELSYEWFCRYRDEGPERSLSKVVQKHNKKEHYKSQLAKWSAKYDWVERVKEYDTHLEDMKRKELEDERVIAAKRQAAFSNSLMDILEEQLIKLRSTDLNPIQFKAIADLAIKTQRDALGIQNDLKVVGDINVVDKTGEKVCKDVLELAEKVLAMRSGKDE